ncbi:hypothetical protein JHK87_024792 [Glycine soja]|nr:hypothetical protein JHK87_024792 [Glycine soja]
MGLKIDLFNPICDPVPNPVCDPVLSHLPLWFRNPNFVTLPFTCVNCNALIVGVAAMFECFDVIARIAITPTRYDTVIFGSSDHVHIHPSMRENSRAPHTTTVPIKNTLRTPS